MCVSVWVVPVSGRAWKKRGGSLVLLLSVGWG